MAHFMLIHSRGIEEAGQDTFFVSFAEVAKTQVPSTKWLRSWMSVDATRMFCLWEAPDVEHIRTALGPERLAMLPILGSHEVVDIDPAVFG